MSSPTDSAGGPLGGRGRLAQVIATRGGKAAPETPFVIEHREALIYMLCEAAELEHGIMCQYLFAAFSLKQLVDEGLTEAELAAVRRWRTQVSHVAAQEMLHLALVHNLLSAIGAAPHLSRPNLPQPASHYPAGVQLALLPFGEDALRHFMFLERPEGMDLEDAAGLAAVRRASPAMSERDIVPRPQDFATVGHLYRSIEAGVAHLAEKYGERWLFVGPPRAQATAEHFGWPELVAVTDVASAQRAIDTILEQGEGPRGEWQNAHFGQFVEILDQYEQMQDANPEFDPVRPVTAVNVRPAERDVEVPLITDPLTARVTDLFNVGYEILLQIFERYFAHTQETDAQLKVLADATIALMVRVIKPLGDLITTLPVGPSQPGRNAGPSFELFYESDYLMPHREAAWALLTERLDEAAWLCEELRVGRGDEIADRLDPVLGALRDIARTLAAHLPAGSAQARQARQAGDLGAAERDDLLARAAQLADAIAGAPSRDGSAAFAELFRTTYSAVRSAASGETASTALPRLVESVLRPLADVLGGSLADAGTAADRTGALTRDEPTADHGAIGPHEPTARPGDEHAAMPAKATAGPDDQPARPHDPADRPAKATAGTDDQPAQPHDPADRPAKATAGTDDQPAQPRALGGDPASGPIVGQVWAAAQAATTLLTRLRVAGSAPPELAEATAALQHLACELAPAAEQDSRLAGLWELQDGLAPRIQTAKDGPYLVSNVRSLRDHLGEPIRATPQLALCRCGGSSAKPFCDGTHARIGFTDGKDPRRVPDRRDVYPGSQVTILDNRGLCQHSGLCTDRLAAAFRTSQEPFVAPSGGRMDEIIRAVRDCPSGALSFAVDGREAREQTDWGNTRAAAIEVTRDGPYRITGGIAITGSDGEDVERNQGASAEHCALCRCGQSQNKPFCSGMHWYVEFRDPVPEPGSEPTLFEWAGGLPALTRMTRLLYEKHVPGDDLLAPLFASMTAGHARQEAMWIAEAFGGPARLDGGPARLDGGVGTAALAAARDGRALTEDQRARWVVLVGRAADEAGLPADPSFRSAFSAFVEWASRSARGLALPGVAGSQGAPAPRWDWGAAGPPDTTESAPADDQASGPVPLPGPGEPVSFAAHIKPLFRERDRQSMSFVFDLWSPGDVRTHSADILDRVRNGSMPCDGAWAAELVEVFQRWTETGMLP